MTRRSDGGGVTEMDVVSLDIPDVKVIKTKKYSDGRGFFSETHSDRTFATAGLDYRFVQDNHSLSAEVGTVRGLHFQIPPFAQDKLVRVVRGAVWDVAIDLRRASPTYGRHVSTVLSAAEWNQILIPIGFAHGFCSLEPDTEVIYKVTNFYSPEHDRGLAWDDPALGIAWPIARDAAILSDKDRRHPVLGELGDYF